MTTANNQYVNGCDQSEKVFSNQNPTSYGGHPGYNQNTGIYSYGSGNRDHESTSTATSNPYSQYTSATLKESSCTTDSSNLGTNGRSFATQYGTDPNVMTSSTGSYFNLPYGSTTERENGYSYPPAVFSSHNSNMSDNTNSTTYMQSNSKINTTTTHSAETRDIPQTLHGSSISGSQQPTNSISTQPTNHASNIDLVSGLNFTISDLTISTPSLLTKSINK